MHSLLNHILSGLFVLIGVCTAEMLMQTKGLASTGDRVGDRVGETGTPVVRSTVPLPELKTLAEATENSAPSQITPVSQLSDIALTDWEYQALQSLMDRYNCDVGEGDRLDLDDRPLSRAEFALRLNVCLDRISQQIAASQETVLNTAPDTVARVDLATLQRLQQEFSADLAALPSRIDALERQIPLLEAAHFSPTGQLNILSSFNLAQTSAGGDILAEGIPLPGISPAARLAQRSVNPKTGRLEPLVGTVTDNPPITLSQSTYLSFSFSSTGRDLLGAIFAVGNGNPPASTFSSAGFTSTFGIPYTDANPVPPLSPNQVGMLELKYSFPVTNDLQITVGPRILPFRHFDVNLYTDVIKGSSGLNFYQSTLANSGLSGAGAIVNWRISPQLTLQGGYLARNDAALTYYGGGDGSTNPRRGLFGGTHSMLAELTYSPSPTANIRLLYVHDCLDAPPAAPFGAQSFPFLLSSLRGVVDDGVGGQLNNIAENSLVLNFDWQLSRQFALFGRYSYSMASIDPVTASVSGGNVTLQAFQLGMAFPDLGRSGALGTLAAVIPFDVVSGRRFLVGGSGDGGTEVDLAAIYSYPIADHVSLVPSFFVTFNPNNFNANPLLYGTTVRLQFLF